MCVNACGCLSFTELFLLSVSLIQLRENEKVYSELVKKCLLAKFSWTVCNLERTFLN